MNDFEFRAVGGRLNLTKYLGRGGDVHIPEKIDGLPVIRIDRAAFENCKTVSSIAISVGVTSIGDSAFSDCTDLTRVTIPDSVTSIEDHAFAHCTNLTSMTIPDSVINMGESAFIHCYALTNVTIGNRVLRIEPHTFKQCESLSNVQIGESVTSIGLSAFQECPNLVNVRIPRSVAEIEPYAFLSCGSLSRILLASIDTRIDEKAFACCSCEFFVKRTVPMKLVKAHIRETLGLFQRNPQNPKLEHLEQHVAFAWITGYFEKTAPANIYRNYFNETPPPSLGNPQTISDYCQAMRRVKGMRLLSGDEIGIVEALGWYLLFIAEYEPVKKHAGIAHSLGRFFRGRG